MMEILIRHQKQYSTNIDIEFLSSGCFLILDYTTSTRSSNHRKSRPATFSEISFPFNFTYRSFKLNMEKEAYFQNLFLLCSPL